MAKQVNLENDLLEESMEEPINGGNSLSELQTKLVCQPLQSHPFVFSLAVLLPE